MLTANHTQSYSDVPPSKKLRKLQSPSRLMRNALAGLGSRAKLSIRRRPPIVEDSESLHRLSTLGKDSDSHSLAIVQDLYVLPYERNDIPPCNLQPLWESSTVSYNICKRIHFSDLMCPCRVLPLIFQSNHLNQNCLYFTHFAILGYFYIALPALGRRLFSKSWHSSAMRFPIRIAATTTRLPNISRPNTSKTHTSHYMKQNTLCSISILETFSQEILIRLQRQVFVTGCCLKSEVH